MPGKGPGSPLPPHSHPPTYLLCPCCWPCSACLFLPQLTGPVPESRQGTWGIYHTPLLCDHEHDRCSEVPLPQAHRLQFPVTKPQCTFCLSPGTSALPKDGDGALCSSSATPPASISLQIYPLTCWPHSLVLGSAPHPSPHHGPLSPMQHGPWARKIPLKGAWVRGSLSSPPLHWRPTVYPAKAKLCSAALSAPSPRQPTLPGSSSQYSSWPLPQKPPFWWKRGIGIPWTSFSLYHLHLCPHRSLLLECTATLPTLGSYSHFKTQHQGTLCEATLESCDICQLLVPLPGSAASTCMRVWCSHLIPSPTPSPKSPSRRHCQLCKQINYTSVHSFENCKNSAHTGGEHGPAEPALLEAGKRPVWPGPGMGTVTRSH